ncbi:hypothetical protein C8F04DRAFT_1280798 [Mycena alexandri]|uniref:Uncharacterized protein n=1 Tax=Mycena alexandri TaxID=1745969 RepID=A0AAD6WKB4_9AGAR|nr:hypothetical protein C8F04DRAFT_1280798 [Mycena alexandri]
MSTARITTGAAPRRAVPTGQAARKRSRKKVDGPKRGKVPWIHGTKLVFFEKRAEEWKVANDLGVVQLGRFYTKVTNLYLLKYGHEMQDDEDLEEDVEDPTDPDVVLPGSENLSEDDAKVQSENTIRVRKRIAAWYCRKYRGVEVAEKELFADLLGGVVSTGPGYPRKAQPIHLYSRKYYEDRVKARFETAWEAEKHRAEALERDPEAEIKIRNVVTREVFEEETQEFREELGKAVEAEHSAAIRAWELTRADAPTKTAAEINAALKNAAFYLEPLAEAISTKFLMNCSILLCGPIGDRGGGIDVRSVHAGTSKSLTPQKWHQFDKMGYDATVKSFVRFSERCFSEDECQSRIVGTESASSTSTVLPPARRGDVQTPATNDTNGAAAVGMSSAQGGAEGAQEGAHEDRNGAGGARGNSRAGGEDGGNAGGGEEDGASQGNAGGGEEDGASGEEDGAGGAQGAVRAEHLPVWSPDEDTWATTWGPEVEEASGFNNEGGKLTTEARPAEISEFINKGRHWIMVRKILAPGSKEEEGSYAARWWAWWAAIVAKGELHTMHGRMGFMLVVLSLLWWGAGDLGGGWETAVTAVTTTLEEVLVSGKVVKSAAPVTASKAPAGKKASAKRRRGEKENDEEDEEDEEGEGEGSVERRTRAKRQKRGDEGQESGGSRITRSKATAGRPRPRPLRR